MSQVAHIQMIVGNENVVMENILNIEVPYHKLRYSLLTISSLKVWGKVQ